MTASQVANAGHATLLKTHEFTRGGGSACRDRQPSFFYAHSDPIRRVAADKRHNAGYSHSQKI